MPQNRARFDFCPLLWYTVISDIQRQHWFNFKTKNQRKIER